MSDVFTNAQLAEIDQRLNKLLPGYRVSWSREEIREIAWKTFLDADVYQIARDEALKVFKECAERPAIEVGAERIRNLFNELLNAKLPDMLSRLPTADELAAEADRVREIVREEMAKEAKAPPSDRWLTCCRAPA